MTSGTVAPAANPSARTRIVSVRSPAPRDLWERLVASDPSVLVSQTPAWTDAVCSVQGLQDASRLYRTSDGRLLVLPLLRRRLLGATLAEASLPHGWGPGGLVGQGGLVLPGDVRAVVADLADRRLPLVTLRPSPAAARVWDEAAPAAATRHPRMAQTLDLEGGFDAVWRTRFKRDTRNRVRRAERAGVLVERDDTGALVPVFQALYQRSVARWARRDGQPLALARWRAARQEPEAKLTTVAATLGGACRVYLASVHGRPAAAIVVLFAAGGASYWRGAMDEEVADGTYANYLLHRTAIEDACAEGCSAYHLGDSAPGSQLALFKSRFGAEECRYASYRLERLPLASALDRTRVALGQALRRCRGRS